MAADGVQPVGTLGVVCGLPFVYPEPAADVIRLGNGIVLVLQWLKGAGRQPERSTPAVFLMHGILVPFVFAVLHVVFCSQMNLTRAFPSRIFPSRSEHLSGSAMTEGAMFARAKCCGGSDLCRVASDATTAGGLRILSRFFPSTLALCPPSPYRGARGAVPIEVGPCGRVAAPGFTVVRAPSRRPDAGNRCRFG
jgi:hypothetical protein